MLRPGKTYKIHLHSSDKLLVLEEGKLTLQPPSPKKPYGKWFWVCVEKLGWLDLRNPVSGTFLGYDSRGGIIAERKHHRDWEYLCFRRHPSGGYTILVKHRDSYWKGSVLGKAALGREDGRSLVETEEEGGGAQWEFEEVCEVGGARSFLFVRWTFETLQASNLLVASLSLSLSHGTRSTAIGPIFTRAVTVLSECAVVKRFHLN